MKSDSARGYGQEIMNGGSCVLGRQLPAFSLGRAAPIRAISHSITKTVNRLIWKKYEQKEICVIDSMQQYQERSVNNSHDHVFVESLKLWGFQEYINYLRQFFFVREPIPRAYMKQAYILTQGQREIIFNKPGNQKLLVCL